MERFATANYPPPTFQATTFRIIYQTVATQTISRLSVRLSTIQKQGFPILTGISQKAVAATNMPDEELLSESWNRRNSLCYIRAVGGALTAGMKVAGGPPPSFR